MAPTSRTDTSSSAKTDESTDGQLLTRFVAGHDEAAFEELLRRHGPLVLGVCRRVLGQRDDADDAFQATFLILLRNAGSISKRESVGSWLHGVAYRVAVVEVDDRCVPVAERRVGLLL